MALQWTKLRFGATLQCNVDPQGMIPKSEYRLSRTNDFVCPEIIPQESTSAVYQSFTDFPCPS
jgi:hypothetical protein